MITEDYISFETAKLLKEKRFDEGCSFVINAISKGVMPVSWPTTNSDIADANANLIALPTLQMAMKWLREVHKIHIIAEPCLGEGNEPNLSFNRWFWTILKEEGEYKPIRKIDEFTTYEEACEEACIYALRNLI